MQQLILPTIPIGATEINGLTTVWQDEIRWTVFPLIFSFITDYLN